jgi:hypothetical protein
VTPQEVEELVASLLIDLKDLIGMTSWKSGLKVLVMIAEDVHTAAIREARAAGETTLLAADVLNAPLDDDAENWITRIWDETELALRAAHHLGIEAARPLIERVSVLTQELISDLGQGADKVSTVIAARLGAYIQKVIEEALKRVRPTISVRGKEFAMTSVTIEQKISLSGSLSAYIQKVIESALQRVRPTISVGGKELAVTSVTIEQKISLSSSLKASLQEVCEFVAAGEISLAAEYWSKPSQ